MPKSNISLCLVENALHEVENLKVNLMIFLYYCVAKLSTSWFANYQLQNLIEEYIERLPSYTTNNDNTIKTPTKKMRMTRRTVATSRRVYFHHFYVFTYFLVQEFLITFLRSFRLS
jgi:hypothetical protein